MKQANLSVKDTLFETHSITCKLCKLQFQSLGDMQRHVVTEHFQKGDIPAQKKEEKSV